MAKRNHRATDVAKRKRGQEQSKSTESDQTSTQRNQKSAKWPKEVKRSNRWPKVGKSGKAKMGNDQRCLPPTPPPPGVVPTPSILGWCRHGRGQKLCRQDVVPNKTKQKLKRGPQPQPAHTLFTRQAPFSHRTAMPSWGRSLVPGAAAAASSAPATCSTVVCPRQAGPAKGQGPVRPVHGVHSSQPLNETVPPRGHMTANNKATVFTPPSRQKYLGWGVALSGNPCGGLC